jgi:DNA-binding beta-propeller fold protein YncE
MLPTSLLLAIRYLHQPGMLARCVVVGAIPAVAWTAWSLYYYGFPFPNTAYAKLGAGVPLSERSVQGGVYLLDSITRDPLTLTFIGAGVVAGLTSSSILDRVLAAGCLLYLAFVVSIGGDFMTGRFLTAPLLVAAVVIARSVLSTRHLWALAAGVGVLGVVGINATLLSGSRYSDTVIDEDTGIADERGFYFQSYGLMALAGSDRLHPRDWTLSGSARSVTIVCGGLGFKGIELGPAAHLIDECGLGDPLLARLPAERTGKWRIGHFERQLPTDYRESVERQANLLRDPRTRAYYESIRTITRGSLNRLERFREIARMNLGLVETPDWQMYRETRVPASLAPANHVLTKLRLAVNGSSNASGLYADAEGRRLYITRPSSVTVFDLDMLQQVAVMDGVGGNGVAVDPRTRHGFISGSAVVMFDTRTMRPVTSIDVDRVVPRGILFDSFTRRVYVLGERATTAAIVDSENGTVVGSVELGGVPRAAEADGHGTLYVLLSDSSAITAVDLGARKVTRRYPLGDYSACNGLALDDASGVLFVTCARSPSRLPMMVILGASDGGMIGAVPLASTPNGGVVFSPATMEAFSTHDNGTMTVVREETPNSFRVEDTVETINRARAITLDSKTGHVFTMSEDPASGSLTVLVIGK